jgi:uncharacterized protein (DUF488 family)
VSLVPVDPHPRSRALVWTIGHGTRTTADLAALLVATRVATIIDVRRFPEGRRQPHLARERLQADLPALGIAYEWWGEALGGRRLAPSGYARPSSWRSSAFAAFDAYMDTEAFRTALSGLESRSDAGDSLAIMCAETLWWRCHRRLIADALVFDGFGVRHLIDQPPGVAHEISAASAVMMGER